MGAVDRLNIDELFSFKQPVPNPSSSSSAATTTAGNHLASITTTMSTAVTGLTSQAAVKHADADQDETIDYKDMPANVRTRYALKNDSVDLMRKSDLKLYQNVLTMDKHGAVQQWRTIKYPSLISNTTKHEGQTYLCMNDGSLFSHLDYQTNKQKSVFLAGAPNMTKWTPKGFYNLCMTMEKAGAIN